MPTQSLAAFEAYMRGKQLMATREAGKLEEAIREFRGAVDLDPNFALAWVGISDTYGLLVDYGTSNPKEELQIRQDAVSKALEIDPLLGEADASLADLHKDRAEYEEMETAYKKAIELSPNYAHAYYGSAHSQARLSQKTRSR